MAPPDKELEDHLIEVADQFPPPSAAPCVMMLDLQRNKLVVEMFGCFLKCMRPDHPEVVFASTEMIMKLVLEECEDSPAELLSCLRKDDNVVSPAGRKLRDRVISNCATKLEPYLTQVQM